MERRPNTLKGNVGLLILFLLLGVACSLRFALTDLIRMDLYPIPLMIVVYLGYKLGRKAGLIAGLICSWFWTVIFVLSGKGFSWSEILLTGVSLREGGLSLVGHSFQHGVIIALLGWVSGYLFDYLDDALKQNGSSISEMLPAARTPRSTVMRVFQFPERQGAAQPPEDKPQLTKSDSRKRMLKKTAVIPFLIVLALVNNHLVFRLPYLEIDILPLHVVTLAVLIWAFYKGSAYGVRLAVGVSVISLILGIYFNFILEEVRNVIRTTYSVGTPGQAAGLVILAWWAGQIGKIYKDKGRLETLSRLWAPLRRNEPLSADPGYGMLFLVFVFIINLFIAMRPARAGVAYTSLSFNLLVLLIAWVSIWSLRHNGGAVSNRIVPLLLVFATFHGRYTTGQICLSSSYVDLLDMTVLCLIPIVIGYLDIKERSHWRIIIFGILIALILPDIYVRGGDIPFFRVLEFSFGGKNVVLLTWALTLAAFELATRIVHYSSSHLR